MVTGRSNDLVCLSTPLDGEYGFTDVSLGVPLTLTADGVGEILTWKLSASEEDQLQEAYETVRSDMKEL